MLVIGSNLVLVLLWKLSDNVFPNLITFLSLNIMEGFHLVHSLILNTSMSLNNFLYLLPIIGPLSLFLNQFHFIQQHPEDNFYFPALQRFTIKFLSSRILCYVNFKTSSLVISSKSCCTSLSGGKPSTKIIIIIIKPRF